MGITNFWKAAPKVEELPPPPPIAMTPTTPYSRRSGHMSRASLHSGVRTPGGEDIRHEVMCNYLAQQQRAQQWIDDLSGNYQGILIRKRVGVYSSAPRALAESRFAQTCTQLNFQSVMTVKSEVVELFLTAMPHADSVPLRNGRFVQILPSLDHLPLARKNQGSAFIANEGLLIVWEDEATDLIERAKAIEFELIEMVWKEPTEVVYDEKKDPDVSINQVDSESGDYAQPERRRVRLASHFQFALSVIILSAMIGAGLMTATESVVLDHDYIRLAVVLYIPVQLFFASFFAQTITSGILQLFGPVKRIYENSELYSGSLPRRIVGELPHVTIQCPVYKEGLAGVIAPTVQSLKQAIATYELQGGTASIFINDDGLQLMSEEDRETRINFYADHSIGWVARPKHGENGFIRRGKFKKASNMNFALMISCRVEDKLAMVHRGEEWTQQDEAVEYERCLKEVLEEDTRAWADGNIRIGDYILIVDSDTRIPSDCLLDAVSEMEQSPNVAIIQFTSGVMQVVNNFFENGITYFTTLVYLAISFVVSNGDYACFVGHNAMLRWAAVQQVTEDDGLGDGYEKFWSESHVSEDFDMALRLQIQGFIVRFVTWAGDGFKEGVSLTVYDELARWQKYAFGCDELVFNPLVKWPTKGPITPLFRKFMGSKMRLQGKFGILAYIGTYYALGACWILTLVNYFAMGWFNGYLDKYYLDSFRILLAVIVVFSGFGPLAFAVLRYRTGKKTFLAAWWEGLKWLPMFTVFFTGVSMHISMALLSHLFSVDMTWGATSKEADNSNFFLEAPKVIKNFKWTMIFWIFVCVGMIVLAKAPFIPWSWNIDLPIACFPLGLTAAGHILLPIALNPALMTFSW